MSQKQYNFIKLNYEEEKAKCFEFLTGFEDASEDHIIHGRKKYMIQMVNTK